MSEHDGIEFDAEEYANQLGYIDEQTRNEFTDPKVQRAQTRETQRTLSRRDLLAKGSMATVAAAGLGSLAGTAAAAPGKAEEITLRVITLTVEWPAGAQAQAEKDLGVKFNVQGMGTNAQVQKSITDPESFDIGGLYNYQFFQIWPTGNFMPVDTRKLTAWNRMYPLFTKGINQKGGATGQGNAPYRVMFVDPDGTSGLPKTAEGPKSNKQIVQWWNDSTGKANGKQPSTIVGPPAHFNMDSMGYNGDVIKKEPKDVSWAELLNSKHKGKVALLNDPGILSQDAALAVQALGLMKFGNIGNQTKKEMDSLFKILTKYKKAGHFRAFWGTFEESVNMMQAGEVVIESMWSPAVALLTALGVNCRYAAPKEGFRGWCSATGIPKHVGADSAKLAAAYGYINWMYSGYLGALIMRQGYYIANGPDVLPWINKYGSGYKENFKADEFEHWYLGKPAARDLPGILGKEGDIKKGQVRDGGSFKSRSSAFSTWNSFFTENVYQADKVNEFLSA